MNLGMLYVARVVTARTDSDDGQIRQVAESLNDTSHATEHLGLGEKEAVQGLQEYVLQALSAQRAARGAVLTVRYSVAQVQESGRIGNFFVRGDSTFTAVLE